MGEAARVNCHVQELLALLAVFSGILSFGKKVWSTAQAASQRVRAADRDPTEVF